MILILAFELCMYLAIINISNVIKKLNIKENIKMTMGLVLVFISMYIVYCIYRKKVCKLRMPICVIVLSYSLIIEFKKKVGK